MNFDIWLSLETLSRKFEFRSNLTRITGTLRDDRYTFLIMPCLTILRLRNFLDKVVNKIKTRFLFSITFFNRALLEIMWRNIVDPSRPQMTIWRMRVPCWYLILEHTHSEYVWYLSLIQCVSNCTNAPHCYVIHTLLEFLLDAWDDGYFYAMWRCAQKSTYFHVKSMLLFSDSTQVEWENNIF
jgi:hypothetical protein